MKKASNVKLSLRKLFTAMMAVGPLAVLPSPVWAALPSQASITVQNGSATVTTSGSTSTIASSDRAVLQWGTGLFNIAGGENYNFQVPPGGAVLNRVGTSSAADTATIAGQLTSNGRVFILANGTINVASGATVSTTGGLVLSAVPEENGAFLATGDLLYVASATPGLNGTINIGTGAAPVNVAGNLTAVGGTVNHLSSSVTGDMILRSVNSGTAVNLVNTAGGILNTGGNLSVSANGGDIIQAVGGGAITVGNTTAATQTASFSTGGGNKAITLDSNVANDFQILTLSAPATGGTTANVKVIDTNIVVLGDTVAGYDLTVDARQSVANANVFGISNTGSISVGHDMTLTTASAGTRTKIDVGNVTIAAGGSVISTVSANSSVAISGTGDMTAGAISALGGNQTSITVSTTGNLTVAGALSTTGNATTGGGTITLTGGNVTTSGVISAGGATSGILVMNATAGNIAIGATATGNRNITLTAAGNITQTAAVLTTNTTSSDRTNALKAGGSIVLDNAANDLKDNVVTQVTATTANITNTKGFILGTTNVTGNLNLVSNVAGQNIMFGTGSGTAAQKVSVGGYLNATTTGAGTITDNPYSITNIFGGLNLTTGGGAITLDAATKNGAALSPRIVLGVVNANAGAGAVTLAETTTLNLGNITAGSLVAKSATEGIVDSGTLTIAGATTLTANNNSSIVLDGGSHSIPTLNVAGSAQASVLVVNSNVIVGTSTGSLTGNLSVTTANGRNITVNGANVVGGLTLNSNGTLDIAGASTVTGNMTFAAAGAVTQTAGLTVTGTTSVAGNAAITLTNAANDFSSVVLNNVSNGAATTSIYDANDLTVSGTASGLADVKAGAGTIGNTWNLTLGNLSVGSLTAEAANGGGGRSGTLTQASKSTIHSEGATAFIVDDNNITVTNTGNSFGALTLTVGARSGSRTVKVTEDGTMKLAGLNSRGTTTLVSRTGSIIEDPGVNVTITNNGTLDLTALSGSILIGSTTKTGAFTTGGNLTAVNLNAPSGAAAVISSAGNGNITIGTTNVASLNVVSSNNIAQSKALRVYGAASFSTTNAGRGNITLDDPANSFGRVSTTLAWTGGNITLVEDGTLNLGTVTVPNSSTGNFTATSIKGDIIDTGLAGVRPGGGASAGNWGTGVVTLTAAGNIVLDDPTTEFPTTGGVVFNAKNVTLSPLGSGSTPIYLGSVGSTSVASGNLTVTSAIGSILSNGALSVAGDASFQAAGTGTSLTLAQSGNKFGTLKFVGQNVAIVESDDMAIVTGSSALGSAQLSSGGNITVKNAGGAVNFNGITFMSATGSITLPKLVQNVAGLTVNAAGTKDLSALSKSADLGGKDPTNLGTGTYLPPGQ